MDDISNTSKINLKTQQEDIDLLALIQTFWNKKWLILGITSLFTMMGFFYTLFIQTNTAIAYLKPISSFDTEKYSELNHFDFFNIDETLLLNLFTERLIQRTDLIQAAKETLIIDPSQFPNNEDWKEAVTQWVYKINITAPQIENDKRKNSPRSEFWEINIPVAPDIKTLEKFLTMSTNNITEEVRTSLERRYLQKISLLKMQKEHKLEDIKREIKNLNDDYNIQIAKQLAFLKEQAEIARSINIQKNALESIPIQGIGSIVTPPNEHSPFYLRGYEAIEKEIDLLQNRDNKDVFLDGLIERIQRQREIQEDPFIERIEQKIINTPIFDPASFKAVSFEFNEIKLQPKIPPLTLISILTLLGLLLSCLIVIIKNSLSTKYP